MDQPQNQPSESKAEPYNERVNGDLTARARVHRLAEYADVYASSGLTPAQLLKRVRELEAARLPELEGEKPYCENAQEAWEKHGITPAQASDAAHAAAKEYWQTWPNSPDLLARIIQRAMDQDRDQLAERVKVAEEALKHAETDKETLRSLRASDQQDRDAAINQLASGETARRRLAAALEALLPEIEPLATQIICPADNTFSRQVQLIKQALAEQPADYLAGREEEREALVTQRDEAQRCYRKEYQMRDMLYSEMGAVLTLLDGLDTVKVSSTGLTEYADAISLARVTIDRAFKQIAVMRGPLLTPSVICENQKP